jgi:uncharacterized protein YndB with AHSA1/START domain
MANIRHRLSIRAPAAQVYRAIATPDAIGTWWDKQTATQTDRGLVLAHDPGPEHGVVQLRVVAQVENERIEWECISSHPKTSPASAWTGTHFVFELAERDGTTTLDFSQSGYDEQSPFFAANEAAWGDVLANLKRVVEARR